VIEDPLDREVRHHRASKLAQHVCQLLGRHGSTRLGRCTSPRRGPPRWQHPALHAPVQPEATPDVHHPVDGAYPPVKALLQRHRANQSLFRKAPVKRVISGRGGHHVPAETSKNPKSSYAEPADASPGKPLRFDSRPKSSPLKIHTPDYPKTAAREYERWLGLISDRRRRGPERVSGRGPGSRMSSAAARDAGSLGSGGVFGYR
jgi:hypothetical protein